MIWMDYTIEQIGENFFIRGDWPGEVMGLDRDGKVSKQGLFKPGDVFVVNSQGVLMKQDKFVEFMENGKRTRHKSTG